MKWLLIGVLLYFVLENQNALTPVAQPMTNQAPASSLPALATQVASQVGTAVNDITGSPVTPANASPAVATPNTSPAWDIRLPLIPAMRM